MLCWGRGAKSFERLTLDDSEKDRSNQERIRRLDALDEAKANHCNCQTKTRDRE